MKRRNFLSCLPFLAPAVVAAVPNKPENPDDFNWHNYRIKWRDYVGEQSSDRMEGFWTAWPLAIDKEVRRPHIVSMTSREFSGKRIVGRYNPGDTFRMGSLMLTRLSSEAEKATAKQESLAALKQFILDEEKPKEEPAYEFKFSGFVYNSPEWKAARERRIQEIIDNGWGRHEWPLIPR